MKKLTLAGITILTLQCLTGGAEAGSPLFVERVDGWGPHPLARYGGPKYEVYVTPGYLYSNCNFVPLTSNRAGGTFPTSQEHIINFIQRGAYYTGAHTYSGPELLRAYPGWTFTVWPGSRAGSYTTWKVQCGGGGGGSTVRQSKLKLSGSWYWRIWGSRKYRRGGAGQSGRYSNLGRGYYRKVYYRSGITHSSDSPFSRSGSMSFEFHRKPRASSTYTYRMAMRRVNPLNRGYHYSNIRVSALCKTSRRGSSGHPTLRLYEYSNGWKSASSRVSSRRLKM